MIRVIITVLALLASEVKAAELLSTRTWPDCFPALGRGPLREEVYAWNGSMRAFLIRPPAGAYSGLLPVVAMFHGGGWARGNPTYWFAPAHYLAARGYATISFEYRLGGVLAATEDAKAAVRWLRESAPELALRSDRIVTVGDSAGGHLALVAALTEHTWATAAYYPVLIAMAGMEDVPLNLLTQASTRPTLIAQGTDDTHPATPPAIAAGYCAAAALYGSCTYSPIAGAAHTFLSVPEHYVRGIADLDRWLSTVVPERPMSSRARAHVASWVQNSASHCSSNTNYWAWSSTYGYKR